MRQHQGDSDSRLGRFLHRLAKDLPGKVEDDFTYLARTIESGIPRRQRDRNPRIGHVAKTSLQEPCIEPGVYHLKILS